MGRGKRGRWNGEREGGGDGVGRKEHGTGKRRKVGKQREGRQEEK